MKSGWTLTKQRRVIISNIKSNEVVKGYVTTKSNRKKMK